MENKKIENLKVFKIERPNFDYDEVDSIIVLAYDREHAFQIGFEFKWTDCNKVITAQDLVVTEIKLIKENIGMIHKSSVNG